MSSSSHLPPSNKIHPFYQQWARILFAYGKALTFILILSSLVLGGLVLHQVTQHGIPLDFTPQSIFLDDGEMVRHLRTVEKEFGREDNDFLLLLQGSALTTTEGKEWIETLHRELEHVEGVTSVLSLVNAPYIETQDGLLNISTTWEQARPWEAADQQEILHHLLSSENGQTQVIQIRVEAWREKVADLQPVYSAIQHAIKRHPPPTSITLDLTGVPHIRTEIVDLMLADEFFYVPVSAVMFFMTIVWLFRGIHLALAPVIAVQISMLWAVGGLILSGVTFNILSMLVPAISMVIGIADGIHLVSRHREDRALLSNPVEAMALTLQEMTGACFLTTLTTAGGFASLLVADTVVIQDFGLHAAIAVSITYIGIMILIPLWLRFIPESVFLQNRQRQPTWTSFFEGLYFLTLHRRGSIIAASVILCGIVGYGASQVSANSFILEMYAPEHPTARALHTIEDELSGIVPVFVHLQSDSSLYTPEGLAAIEQVEAFINNYTFIRWKTSLATQQRMIHRAITGTVGLPTTEDLLAQERLLTDLGGGLPTSSILSADERQARILLLSTDVGGVEFLRFKQDFDLYAKTHLPNTIQWTLTGDGMLASIGIDKLIVDLFNSVLLVFLVIILVLAFLLRSPIHTLLAFIPNVLPLLTTLALLEWVGRDLQVSNIVSFTVAIGLAVDDTIHFVVRYHAERKLGHPHLEAMNRTLKGSGHAIILTSILLVCGFGLLSTSDLSSTFYFGILTAVTLISALFADLLLLPAMLNWWELRGDNTTNKAETDLT